MHCPRPLRERVGVKGNMAYSIDVKEKAFGLYCQGYSYDRIIEALAQEDINLARRTLIKWEKQYGWKIRRQKIIQEAKKKTDEKHANELAELNAQLAELQNDLIGELKNVQLKSKEGGITALRQLHEMRERLLGDKRFEQQIDQIIMTVFEIMANDEKIGPLLQDRQQIVIEKLEKILKEKYGLH